MLIQISFYLQTEVADLMWQTVHGGESKFQHVCGVPYTALPIATCISVKQNIPMLIRRKEGKDYGTKKMVEGHFKVGDKCLIVEDIVTSGSSVLETVQTLNNEGIKVDQAIVLLDREQGGKSSLANHGITLHSVLTLTQVVKTLHRMGKIESSLVEQTEHFIKSNRHDITVPSSIKTSNTDNKKKVCKSYRERSESCQHSLSKKLYSIMETKLTNLALSVDLTKSNDILQIVDTVGPFVCIVKTHVDIVEDFSQSFVNHLSDLAKKHNFILFEDRKFADIGNTVNCQYNNGIFKISSWADIVNVHPVPGEGVIAGIKQTGLSLGRGCLLVAEMSSKGNLATGDYTKAAVKMAENHKDFVIGFICQSRLTGDPNFIHMTPGVKLSSGDDALGQQYSTPEDAVINKGADVIIVGRGIIQATDPVSTAKQYQQAGYNAYLQTLK